MGKIPTKTQVSAGGVAYRWRGNWIQVAIISVNQRWQLPKGIVGKNEPNETTAIREVREETGLEVELVELIDTIEYWYYSKSGGKPVRFHKFVHFFLLRFLSGNTEDHDHEVQEARWVEIDEAYGMLTFESEKKILAQAKVMIAALPANKEIRHD